jgi:hypothetical protein
MALPVEVVRASQLLQIDVDFLGDVIRTAGRGLSGRKTSLISSVMEAPPDSVSVAQLVGQARAGERQAEESICKRFAPVVRAFARRRLRGKDAIEEFAQDVLLLTIEAVREGRVEQPERLGGFVLGICRSLAFDRVRQRERRQTLWETYGCMASAWRPCSERRIR